MLTPPDHRRLRETERWIAWIRLLGVVYGAFQVAFIAHDYPPGYERAAWAATGAFGVAAAVIAVAAHRRLARRSQEALGLVSLAVDVAAVYTFMVVFSYHPGAPVWGLLYLPVIEGAVRYGMRGGVVTALGGLPLLTLAEWWRAEHFEPGWDWDFVLLPGGLALMVGLVVGWLVRNLVEQTDVADARAREAEGLRDELGRRLDLLEAANRCARALASSLVLDQAFDAFTQALRGVVPFDRMIVTRHDEGGTRIVASAGIGAEDWQPGAAYPSLGGVLERVLDGATQLRRDMQADPFPEEEPLVALGLRSRVVAPLQLGGRTIGFFSVSRREPDAFSSTEVELVTLLGRLIGSAVQNIRAYEAERERVEELRRLSTLRADFVSLVSHELRSPMAAVIGSARTLQSRWRDLRPDQRDAFLAVIGDETSRLSSLIEDVLHTSRIEAGTFSYRFGDVDLARLVRDSVAAAELAQDEVPLRADVGPALPVIRGDADRLRQLLDNLISNAVKYSAAGDPVEVAAHRVDGSVRLTVADRGPGIAEEYQRLVFEKFGRVHGGGAKPGTGLGLFIARSIAEAHGGRLELDSKPGQGATFSVILPC